jgi:hypothetical protein
MIIKCLSKGNRPDGFSGFCPATDDGAIRYSSAGSARIPDDTLLPPGHICLDKQLSVWFMGRLNSFFGVTDYEKDIDEFQQYEDEANPRLPRPDGHQGRPGGPEQETGEREKATGGVIRGRTKGRSGRPRKGAVRHGNPNLWQR